MVVVVFFSEKNNFYSPLLSLLYLVVFGHYPLSTVYVDQSSKGITLRGLSRKFSMYLCGHLHTLLDIAPNLHMRHSNELAELEIGDWKDNRR